MQENPDVRSEEEIKSIIIEFSNAKTQEEIEHVESKIRSLCSHEKNLYVLCNLVTDPNTERSLKLLIISSFNVVLQELLKRLQEANRSRFSRYENKKSEETKRIVMNFTSRLEKIIDGIHVSPEIKKIAIRIQLKLQYKSNDEFDVQRTLGKMDFYFRKQNSLVGITYFNNLVDFNMNLKQKVDIYIKVASGFPNIASASFMKILKGNIQIREDFNEYQNFEFIFEEFVSFVNRMPNEVIKENTLNWCNNDLFLTLIQSIHEQLELCENKKNPDISGVLHHPEQSIRVWKENLLVILEKVSANIHRHKVENSCGKFIQIFSGIVSKSYLNVFFPFSEESNSRLEQFSGQWIPLYTNAVKLKCFPREFILSQNSIVNENEFDFCALSQNSKIFYMSHYLFRLYSILRDKTFLFMNSESKEDRNEFLDFFEFFSNDQQEEDSLENFDLNFARFLQSIVETYSEVCYFTKKIIICLLFSYDKNYMNQVQWQVESEISAIEFCITKFNIVKTQTIEMGLLLSLIFYRELNKDREFLKDCIETFMYKVAEDADNENSIFKQEPIVITIFLMFFENYLPEVPICVFSQDHAIYRFSNLTDRLILELSNTNNESISLVYISSIKKYAGLIKNLIFHLKKILQERSERSRFDSSTHPLYFLQTFKSNVPIPFYAKVYQELIHYDIFRGNGEPLEVTQNRVREILNQMIGYEGSENKILYYHQIFEVLNTILSCEEYANIYSLVFEWIKNLTKDSLQARREFEDDSTALCLKLLKKPEIVASLSQDELRPFWIVVYSIVELFEWQEEFSDMEMISAYSENQERDKENKKRKKDQLLMMYLSITQNCPSELVFLIFEKAEKNLSLIIQSTTFMNRKMEFSRQRPYHLEEISFLVILHKVIQFCNEQMNEETIEKILSLFWKNLEFRNEFPFDFNYVNGKYNLLVVLLMRYKFLLLNKVLEQKGNKMVEEIHREVYFNEKYYRVEYDIGIFVKSTIETLSFIWSPLYDESNIRILVQNAHLGVGACIFCLDRADESNRYSREEELTIDFLENMSRLPLISHFLNMREIISTYIAYEPYFDEFEYLRKFYLKMCGKEETQKWFTLIMTMYVRQELHCSSYEEILAIHKIKKKDGSIVYRRTKVVNTEMYK